jgi:periplasmic divalent cation tolerance protein
VKKKCVACVNILGEIKSIYEWKGTVERSSEIALIAKTTASAYPSMEKIFKECHSYECPCIVAWPIEKGHGPFLEWVKQSVATR